MALTTPPRIIPDLIKCLKALDLDRCMAFASKSMPQDIEMLLQRPETRVNQCIFLTAVIYDINGAVVEVLLRYHGEEFSMNNEVLLIAIKKRLGAKETVENLLQYRRY